MEKVHIELTGEARARLETSIDPMTAIQLVYDTEGCGCAVSGVPQLWLIERKKTDGMLKAGDETLPIYIEPHHTVFFEPHLKLSYHSSADRFHLTSDQQIYHYGMKLIRKSPQTS